MSLKKLTSFALLGAVITSGTGIILYNKIEKKMKNQSYFVDAMETFKNHPGVKVLVGEPVKFSKVDLSDEMNYTDGLKSQIKVPVYGSKGKGTMYFWADREDVKDVWVVKRIELELSHDKTRRLLVKNVDNSESVEL